MMQKLSAVLTTAPERVVAAYLFGSFARERAAAQSDVDVAVLLRGVPPSTLAELPLDLEAEIEAATGRRAQVVVLNTAPPDLIHRVFRDGRLLLDRDPATRIGFEVQARNEYFDLVPFLRRYRRLDSVAP